MSGHSKWSQIKHKKGASDQKRGQLFSKLSKKISVAARNGADPAGNYKLQAVIEEARSFNMPKDNIERAIKRASDKDAAALNEIIIQAMGPGGIAIVVEAITDNKNRTINETKHILGENGFKMVNEGSLNWMFAPHLSETGLRSGAEQLSQKGAGFGPNWVPHTPLEIDQTAQDKLDRLFEELDANDDVENVHTNLK